MEKQIEELSKRVEELTRRVESLEKHCSTQTSDKKRREKRPPSEKQREQHARFKKAYDKYAPEFKKENPALKSHEIF